MKKQTIKRYQSQLFSARNGGYSNRMAVKKDGNWVRHKDVETLIADNDRLLKITRDIEDCLHPEFPPI